MKDTNIVHSKVLTVRLARFFTRRVYKTVLSIGKYSYYINVYEEFQPTIDYTVVTVVLYNSELTRKW